MARPLSEDRRTAILTAATRVIASDGLGASTAAIAKEARVSNGSLFVYFETKAALLNELYVALKTEMAATASAGLSAESEPREQVGHMWTRWLGWATPDVSLDFALTLVSAIAEAAIDAILREPAQREARSQVAFGAIWRVLAGA